MYKVILKFQAKVIGDIHTLAFTYYDLAHCREQIKMLKDRYVSMGATIFELRIYKVEQIPDPDQI